MAYNPKDHVMRVQGNNPYLPVSERLVWFREEHREDWGIETEPVEINLEKQYAIFRATIWQYIPLCDGNDGCKGYEKVKMATATKYEDRKGFADFIEKAESGSVGRALAHCGYGTQFPMREGDTETGAGAVATKSEGVVWDDEPVREAEPDTEEPEETEPVDDPAERTRLLNNFRKALKAARLGDSKDEVFTQYCRLMDLKGSDRVNPNNEQIKEATRRIVAEIKEGRVPSE